MAGIVQAQATQPPDDEPTVEPAPEPAAGEQALDPGAAVVVATGTSAPIAVDGTGVLVVLTDHGSRVPDTAIQVRIGEAGVATPLMDAGSVPDMRAGDGIYTGLVVSKGSGTQGVTIETQGGAEIWSGQIDLVADLESPSLRIQFSEDGTVDASYRSDGAGAQKPVFEGGSIAPNEGQGLAPQAVAEGGVVTVANSDSRESQFFPILIALGLVLGAFGSVEVRKRMSAAPPLFRVGGTGATSWPSWLKEGRGDLRFVRLGAGVQMGDVLGAAVRWFAGPAVVLTVCRDESRGQLESSLRGRFPVYWLESARPTVSELEKAIQAIGVAGDVVVVVEGADALEEPDVDESPDAVIRELEELAVRVLVLMPGDFELEEDGLVQLELTAGGCTSDGLLVMSMGETGGPRWIEDGR